MIKFMYNNKDEDCMNKGTRYQITLTNCGDNIDDCFTTFFRFMVSCSYTSKQLENKMRKIVSDIDEQNCDMNEIIWSF